MWNEVRQERRYLKIAVIVVCLFLLDASLSLMSSFMHLIMTVVVSSLMCWDVTPLFLAKKQNMWKLDMWKFARAHFRVHFREHWKISREHWKISREHSRGSLRGDPPVRLTQTKPQPSWAFPWTSLCTLPCAFSWVSCESLGACAMTTKFLDNKIFTFKILLSWRFPRKIAFWRIFLSAPLPTPPWKTQILFFIVVSLSLRVRGSNFAVRVLFACLSFLSHNGCANDVLRWALSGRLDVKSITSH